MLQIVKNPNIAQMRGKINVYQLHAWINRSKIRQQNPRQLRKPMSWNRVYKLLCSKAILPIAHQVEGHTSYVRGRLSWPIFYFTAH